MNDVERSDLFEELKKHDVVVAYEDENNKMDAILKDTEIDYSEVNLEVSQRLKIEFMKHFEVAKLPVLLIKGTPVLENPEKKIQEYIEERRKKALRKIQDVIDPSKVVLFIKGSPEYPKCGFTRTLMDILLKEGVKRDKIAYFDVLSDEDVRRELKKINNWPTFPQVYIGNKFIGGLDIVRKISEKGRLKDELSEII
ncbi:glutaredoxin domain-containing protein [Encephalitozoon hellem ATCC 50504]|uniref:Glutaredoxin-like protein n=1 Tax=Encephalitozoon hellem TaxID=27973 RepID=A0A9Q9FBI8_ENCHE|nr:glutaredoxin domain-containing protein [Encephalitozoon hellem ATCC 50504]AFM98359.1 glutaredoxin domain-containing protein [Encephalitozoon hellem ATCC 50504]UTX43240.1 glutaredoxin-like protein [Encephalitozoon hellem]|eukprot:XP_003887340.1 glutaredoxin domain-containing protein [Encephalitozoon hellem ATCC 50504]